MEHRYPMHIEEDKKDIDELIALNEELYSKNPDDALKTNLIHLKNNKEEEILVKKREYDGLKIIKTNEDSEKHITYATTTNEKPNQQKYNRTTNLFNNLNSSFVGRATHG